MATARIIRPGVQVQQVLKESSPVINAPAQPTVVIGPNYQILSGAPDGDYDGTQRISQYPGLEAGALIRPETVQIRLTEVVSELGSGKGTLNEDNLTTDDLIFGSRPPAATLVGNAVASRISGFLAPGPVMGEGPFELKVDAGVAAGSFVFEYNGVKSDEFAAWPVAADGDITIDGGEAGKITFTPAAQAPEAMPATDTVRVTSATYSRVGDIVRMGSADNFVDAKIVSIAADGKSARLDREPGFPANTDFRILRFRTGSVGIAKDKVEENAETYVLPADLTVSEPAGADTIQARIYKAKVQVDFEALRTANAGRLITIENTTQLKEKLGVIDERNPLALGAFVAKSNTISGIYVMAIDENSTLGYARALDALNSQSIYSIVCLTQSMAVATMLRDHCKQVSEKKSRFRIGFTNLSHPFEEIPVQKAGAALFDSVIADNVQTVSLVDANAIFSGNVFVGDILQTFARSEEGDLPTADARAVGYFRVRQVVNNSRLRLEPVYLDGGNGVYVPAMPPKDAPANWTPAIPAIPATSVDYQVIRVLDRDGQANAIAMAADSFNERRLTYITNAECVIELGEEPNKYDVVVPGYYIAAAIAGMCSGFPPHQGFTNLGISGIKSVRYADRFFTEDQMELIAGSGGFLVCQESDTAMPAAYIQTTTDHATVQRRELSFTRVLDFYCTYLKNTLQQYIGPYNIYSATFTTLSNAVNAVHQDILGMEYDKIGTPVLDAKLDKLVQNTDKPDQVDIVSTIVVPMPLNNISVTVYA